MAIKMYNRKWVKVTAVVLAVLIAGSGLGVGVWALFAM